MISFKAKTEVICAHCGKTFTRLKSQLKPYKVFFCSSFCLRNRGVPMIQLICPCCAKAFEIKQSKYDYFKKLGKEKLITCSRECRVKHTSARKRHIYSPFLTLFYATHHNAKGLYCELELQDLKNLWEKQKGL